MLHFNCYRQQRLDTMIANHLNQWFSYRMAAEFPPELTAIPLEDIDPYYQNKKVNPFFFYP